MTTPLKPEPTAEELAKSALGGIDLTVANVILRHRAEARESGRQEGEVRREELKQLLEKIRCALEAPSHTNEELPGRAHCVRRMMVERGDRIREQKPRGERPRMPGTGAAFDEAEAFAIYVGDTDIRHLIHHVRAWLRSVDEWGGQAEARVITPELVERLARVQFEALRSPKIDWDDIGEDQKEWEWRKGIRATLLALGYVDQTSGAAATAPDLESRVTRIEERLGIK